MTRRSRVSRRSVVYLFALCIVATTGAFAATLDASYYGCCGEEYGTGCIFWWEERCYDIGGPCGKGITCCDTGLTFC